MTHPVFRAALAALSVTLLLLAPSCASASRAPGSAAEIDAPDTLGPGRYALGVLGMSCPKCISNVDLQFARIDGVSNVRVDMKNGVVAIDVGDRRAVSKSALFAAVSDAGFTLTSIRATGAAEGAR